MVGSAIFTTLPSSTAMKIAAKTINATNRGFFVSVETGLAGTDIRPYNFSSVRVYSFRTPSGFRKQHQLPLMVIFT
jgi:hypothetical protein